MARTFTRQEFYEMVWSKPLTHWAKEFRLSDSALHKVCAKHEIPHPPVGWWAKKEAGLDVAVTDLPPVTTAIEYNVTIVGKDIRSGSEALDNVREQARVVACDFRADEGAKPSAIVKRTAAKLATKTPEWNGLVVLNAPGLIRCELSRSSIERFTHALDLIAATALHQGFRLVTDGGPAVFYDGQETISFSVSETSKRTKHSPTADEIATREAWHRKRNKARLKDSWADFDWVAPHIPEWDYNATGVLAVELEYFYDAGSPTRSAFRDGKTQTIESLAGDIAVELAVISAAKKQRRERNEREAQAAAERDQRRVAEALAREIEAGRNAALTAVLDEMRDIERLRELIGILAASTQGESRPRVDKFADWAMAQLLARQSRLTIDGLEDRFTQLEIFD